MTARPGCSLPRPDRLARTFAEIGWSTPGAADGDGAQRDQPEEESTQHNLPVDVRDGDAIRTVPAGLSVFPIGDDGKLTFVRKYDIDVGPKTMFWMGMVQL